MVLFMASENERKVKFIKKICRILQEKTKYTNTTKAQMYCRREKVIIFWPLHIFCILIIPGLLLFLFHINFFCLPYFPLSLTLYFYSLSGIQGRWGMRRRTRRKEEETRTHRLVYNINQLHLKFAASKGMVSPFLRPLSLKVGFPQQFANFCWQKSWPIWRQHDNIRSLKSSFVLAYCLSQSGKRSLLKLILSTNQDRVFYVGYVLIHKAHTILRLSPIAYTLQMTNLNSISFQPKWGSDMKWPLASTKATRWPKMNAKLNHQDGKG